MKILLSAYACEPNKGSEPGVGWNWAITLARLGHDVWVLTRKNNRANIETEISRNRPEGKLTFIYYDPPRLCSLWKKGRRGIHLFYLMWQWGAYNFVRKIHDKECFDLVHHVTFVIIRHPSFMGNLGIPFIFGPVAGGDAAPWRLRRSLGFWGNIKDLIRDFMNAAVKVDPMMCSVFRKADKIFVTSKQSLVIIPKRFHFKTKVHLAIGSYENIEGNVVAESAEQNSGGYLKLLFIGQFLGLKGVYFALNSFAKFVKENRGATLTMVGEGPEEENLHRIAKILGIADRITWHSWLPQDKLAAIYARHDLLLFPSLRDSGGMVALEAMARGLPVVCLDLGGPGVIVNQSCGRVIKTGGRSEQEVIAALSDELNNLNQNHDLMVELGKGALVRCKDFNWLNLVTKMYADIQRDIFD